MTTAASNETHWADTIAAILNLEIDAGRLVRVSLPGSAVPILVESAARWGDVLGIKDPQGARYYLHSSAGIVVLAEPIAPQRPDEKPYWMSVDGG